MKQTNTNRQAHLGRQIERMRLLKGLTQAELGRQLGITKQAVSKMERIESMNEEKVKQVAKVLGVTEAGLKCFTKNTVLYEPLLRADHRTITPPVPTLSLDVRYRSTSMTQIITLFEELLRIKQDVCRKHYR